MSVVCVAWSSHVGALMSAASRPGMPSVRVLSSRMLEEPDGVERCLETMRSATALFVFRTTDALWDPVSYTHLDVYKRQVTYGTAGWSRMLDEKHVGDGLNSVPETQGSISFRLRLLWQHLR